MIRQVLRIAAVVFAVLLAGHAPVVGQATGTGDGSKTGDGTTPFTSLAQAPEANLFLGSATTKIQIEVPPGRGPMTPQLALPLHQQQRAEPLRVLLGPLRAPPAAHHQARRAELQ